MYKIRIEESFDSAHFLAGYEGKCSNLHGHRWRIVMEAKAETLHEDGQLRGMVLILNLLIGQTLVVMLERKVWRLTPIQKLV